MNDLKYISDYRIVKIFKESGAWKIEREVKLQPPTDFIGLTNVIVVE